MASLSALKQQYTNKTGVSNLLTQNQQQTVYTHLQEEDEARKNQGGFFGGIGYAFEKLGLGFLSSIEGIWDYTAGGLAKLFGADEWAEQQFANDWVNYGHADEWFNPSEGWQFVGDVAGGIGTSLPAIATVVAAGVIAVASGGTLSPVAAALISGAVAGLGAAGNATKEAYRQTGELGGKEFGYGALVGITEGAVEGLSAGIGAGTGQIVKGISKSFGKEVAESAARQTIGKTMLKGFIGEAFEEGLSEILDPVWARLTYDPNAKNATLQEVGYAALVGGLSGAIMGGVDVSIRNVHSMSRGNTIVKEGKSSNVISMAEQLSTYESQNHTGYEQFATVDSVLKELQTSMKKTNGDIKTAKQKMLLGVLEQANTTAAFTPFIARSAENIVNNADVIAEKLTAYGIKDAQGNPVTFTAEQIRSGVDANNTATFVNALKENSVLRSLAVADATGQLAMDTAKFKDATLRGQQLSSQVDLNQFIENATDAERQAVSERLGIDDWNTLTNEQFQSKIVEFVQNGGVEAYQQENATIKSLQELDATTAKNKIPARLNLKKDGTVRYSEGTANIAVVKNGDSYRIYDYDSGKYSKSLTQAEASKALREIKKAAQTTATPAATPTVENSQQTVERQAATEQGTPEQGSAVKKITEQINSEQQQTKEIDAYVRENVSDYAKLNAPNQSMIRSIIRQGRAVGIADADVLSYARVAAHTGINVVFDKSLCAVAVNNDTGEKVYADGYYDASNNRFVVNPETSRTHEALLLHELTHAIYRTADGKLILERGVKNMSQSDKDAIIKRYRDAGHGGAIELMDEINAHYAEGILTNKNMLERLIADKPKFKDRILSFFKKSSTAYEGDVKLTKAANSLYKRYQKLFDSFSERNSQYNAAEYRHTAPNAETRLALQESFDRLGKYTDDEIRSIETSKLYQVARSYDDVKTFITRSLNTSTEKRLFLGKITAETAAKIKTETDIDADGKSIALSSSDIKHIFKNHGADSAESMRGQIPITEANFENIIETLIEPETVTRSDEKGRVGIVFKKEIDGKVTAITIMSEKKKALTLKSAWITKEKQSTTPTSNVQALNLTSETGGRIKTAFDNSISENGKKVNPKTGKRYALSQTNSQGYELSAEQREFFKNSAITDSRGRLLVLYHQTGADFTVFDTAREGAGASDYLTPHGIFMKPTASNIGLSGSKQMMIYANITTPLMFDDRTQAERYYREHIKGYGELVDEIAANDKRYNAEFEEAFNLERVARRKNLEFKKLDARQQDALFAESERETEKILNEWTAANDKLYKQVKKLVDEYIKDSKYDGIILERDEGSFGRQVRTIIALEPNQVKNVSNAKPTKSNDIRYALADMTEEQYRFVSKLSEIQVTLTDNNHYNVYCENNSGLLEYEANNLTYEKLAKYFGEELAVDMTYKATEKNKTVKILRGTIQGFAKKYESLGNINADIYKVAKKKFGTTTNPKIAGYINTDGTMLDFSGGNNYRLFDHRDISEIMSDVSGDRAMNEYIGQGNIRIMPESPALEMNYQHEPTDKQYGTIRKVLDEFLGGLDTYGRLDIEFSDGSASIASRSYTQADSTLKILSEIRHFYKRGSLPVQSELSKFRYALPETDAKGKTLTPQQREYFQNSKIVDDDGKLLTMYHGTKNGGFTTFGGSNDFYYFARDKKYTRTFAGKKKNGVYFDSVKEGVQKGYYNPQIYEVYLKIENPLITEDRDIVEWALYEDRRLAEMLRQKGYDGLMLADKSQVIALSPNQIKLTSNKTPTQNNDIRYALDMSKRQDKTSAATSINSAKLPVLYGKVAFQTGTVNLDIGGGRFDNVTNYLAERGVKNYIYDPYNRSAEHNAAVAKVTQEGQSDTVTISNVLNVIDSVDGRRQVLENAVDAVKADGTVYITVYEGDGSGVARTTGKDQFQLNRKTVDYVAEVQEYFDDVTVKNKVIIAKTPKKNAAVKALPDIDSTGKRLTEQQREFFADSKVVDEKGQLLAVYHGTDEQFTVFDKSKIGKTDEGMFGRGFYFASEKSEAADYGASVKKYYLNIKNPLEISRRTGYASVLDYYLKQRGIFCETHGELVDLLNSGFVMPSKAEITSIIRQNGYDGVIYNNGYNPAEYVAFESEQIKLASAKKPTSSKDIRYSLPSDISERDSAYISAVERGDMETVQRFVDEAAKEAGYKIRVYHGTPTGGFTVFKTLPAYVTENQDYASRYQSSSASSIRFGKKTTTPEVKSLFLNPKYLFDTRRPAVRERFFNDYVQGGEMNGYDWGAVSGMRTELTERGLPDWTEGESIADYIRAKKLKYNGIVLDEGKTGGYDLYELYDRGISFAVMNPSALKSADAVTYDDNGKIIPLSERFKKADTDIRYALPDDDFQQRVTAAQDFRDEARQYKRRVKINYDGSVTVYHGTSAVNANKILSTGIINEQSYFTTNKSEADYYANGKHSGGVVLELRIDPRNLEFAAAGAELYAPARLERVDGVFANKNARYALPDDKTPVDGMSRGQRAKFAANNTRLKVYSKIDATEIINSIIDERLVFGDKYGSLSGKSRAQVIDTLFTKLNNTAEGYRLGVALDIADYVIDNAVLTDMYDSYDDTSYSMEVLSAIRKYMHRVDLSGIKGEIQYKFDKKNSISLVWGAKQGGLAPDVIAQELEGYGIRIEAINEADQFLEMLEIYEKAKSDVSKKADKVKLTAYGSKEQIGKLRQQIARDILNAYDEKGTQSKYGKLVEKYTNQIASLTKQVKQARRINSITNSLIDSAQYLRDIAAKRNYVGAEVFTAPELTSWLKNLGKLKYRSDLRKAGARKILLDYGKFYNTNNPLLYDADPNLTYIDNNVLDALNFIRENENSTKPLSLEELQAAQVIMASAKHLFQNYDQMTMEGKKVRISEAAAEGNTIIQQTKSRVGRGFFNNIYGVFNKIVEPRVVIKSFENYNPNGILTRAYNEITRGETSASLQYIQLVEKFDDYFKTNKKYRKRLTSEYITVAGAELNVGQALSLFELSKREQAKEGLYEAGFSYVDRKGQKQTVKITESDIDTLQKAFTDSDKQFIALVEDFFNVQAKKVKTDADLQILGYTNASDDFYFPIQRDKGTIAKNITDARDLMADWANVYNFSFNKDVKTGAKNKIFVPEIWSVITRHAKQLSTYAHLTVPLKNFSQIYSKNIGSKTDVKSIRNTLNEQVWGGADAYLSKLFSDIQGKATSSSVIEKLRGAYAKYQLGANLKVIVSQLTSYPTAGIELDFKSMVKGVVMKTDYAAMDKYCDYARVRNYEKGVVKAEGVIDKVGKVGDIMTKPIQWTDRAAIGKIWNACQVQIERTDGHKVGTVENMKAAGVLLEEVIRLTQPNYTNTERSALMRSDSDIVRSFTMFTSVPLKQLSRLVESVGEYKALRQMIKSGDTNADVQSRYKKAKKKLGKTLASITVANLMYTMVAQFFKWLYAKDRKDKDGNEISFVQDFFTDFASTTIGMFPVVKDIYNYFANDYEFSNFAYDSVNSILSASKDLFEVATKAAGGEPLETSDYMKPLRNSIYAIGQVTGLPVRNLNNMVSGIIKRFSPATAYKYNSIFYNAQYSKDIKSALAKGDTELADTIMGLLLDEDKAGNVSDGARKKLIALYEQGYSVLPKSVGDSLSYNGETIKLTAQQREKFKAVYSQANNYVERMVQNKAFGKLSDEKQAKAIKQVYDAYYDKALAETLGVTTDNKLLLVSKFVGMDALSIVLAGISEIQSDYDKNGAVIQGSKKKKVIQYLLQQNLTDAQRLMILYLQGYTLSDNEYKRLTADRAKRMVISSILTLKSSTQAEKIKLAELCGVEVKNGRIVTKSLYTAK